MTRNVCNFRQQRKVVFVTHHHTIPIQKKFFGYKIEHQNSHNSQLTHKIDILMPKKNLQIFAKVHVELVCSKYQQEMYQPKPITMPT